MRPFLALAALAAVALLATGCSEAGKKDRALAAAKKHYAAGELDKAEIEYKNVLQLDGANGEAVAGLGIVYFDQGRISPIFPLLNRAKQLQPANVAARTKLGMFYLAAGKFPEAAAEAEYVLKTDPKQADAPLLLASTPQKPEEIAQVRKFLSGLPSSETAPVKTALAVLELRENRQPAAAKLLDEAIAAAPKYADAHAIRALLHLAAKDNAKAEEALKAASDLAAPRTTHPLQYARFKAQSGDAATPRRILESMVAATPDYLPGLIALCQFYAGENKIAEAEATLAKVLARDAFHPEAVLLNAQLRIAKGDHAKAIEDLERARNTFPKMPELLFLLGRAHILRGTDDKRAEECLQQALFVQPEHVEANLLLSSLQLKKGEAGAAVTQLQKFLQKQPRQLRGWLLLADALRAQNNFTATLKVYDEVDKLVPNNPQTALMRGLVHLQQNKRPEARAAFLEALKRYPDFAPADEQLVGLDVVEKRFADARARVDARLRKDPENAENHLLLARVCAASDDRKGAEAALNQVIKLRPDTAIPYILLANLYLADKQVDSALAKLEEALAKNPRNLQALMMAATLHDTRKEAAKARAYYEKIVELSPKFAPALNNLAYLYSANPAELEKAFELAQKARELRPQDPNIADTLGWILYQRKQYAWAVTVLQESADKLAGSAEVQYHLGMARYMVGNEDLALAALQKAVDAKQDFPGLAEARSRLEILRTDVEKLGAAAREEFLRQHGAKTDDPVLLARVGRIHELAKDHAKAAAAYDATLKISPKNIPVTLRLAEVHQARKDTAPALELLRNARKFAPDDPDVAGALGRLSFAAGEHTRAYTLLQEAVQRRADSADLLFEHARAAFAVGRQEEAETTWAAFLKVESSTPRAVVVRRSLELSTLSRSTNRPLPATAAQKVAEGTKESPEEAVTLLASAVQQLAANDQASAQRTLEKTVAAYPNQAQANRLLALTLPTSNPQSVEKAYEFAMKARETLSEDVELRRRIAILLFLKGELPRALSALREVAERLPKDGEISYYEGMILHRQKNLPAATKALQKALDLGLSPALAAEARKLLAQAN